jgi:hypothetical protein
MRALTARISQHPFIALQIGLLALTDLFLRLRGLGYSNFQGDEITALCSHTQFRSLGQLAGYMFAQRKGPLQFLLTCAYSYVDPHFSNELTSRLPFALANLMALALFSILVYRLYTLQIAIYSTFFLATNGIFVAFARIVQYQSFVILAVLTALLAVTLALQREKWRVAGLYLGFLAAAAGLLGHFDAVFVLPPLAVLVWHWWRRYRSEAGFRRLVIHLLLAATLASLPVVVFYYEYALRVGPGTTSYWTARFTGEPTDIIHLFQFYNPGPVVWLFIAAAVIGLTRIRLSVNWQVILAWLIPPLIFMGSIFRDSRTHAYTYLLPLMVVAGVGVDTLVGWAGRFMGRRAKTVAQTIALVGFLLLGYLSYAVLIDHHPEYPWYPKRVLGMQLPGGELVGTFGFPYARDWRTIGAWFAAVPRKHVTVVTNDNEVIAGFYLPSKADLKYRYLQSPGHVDEPRGLYFLVVQGPQSWRDQLWGWSLDEWRQRVTPLKDFRGSDGQVVASVYFLSQEQLDALFP